MTTKVFVGNLSFKIGGEKLREEFSVAGNVLSANIITRGPRSLGYGFVEFGSIEDAEKAVALLNHKDIDGREINVEVAKPRADLPPSEGQEKPQKRTRRRAPRQQGQGQQQQPPQSQGQQHQAAAPRTRPQGQNHQGQQTQQGGPAPRRREYRPRYQNQDNAAEGQVARNTTTTTAGSEERPFKPRNRRPRNRQRNQQGQGQQQQQGEGQGQQQPQQQGQGQQFQRKRQRAPQEPKKQQERVASTTTLFVANLPFSVDDKELAEIFSKNLKVVNAHVVKKRNTRSKGFGFVEFENEADQQAALKDFDGSTVHERVLNVKVALTAVPGEQGAEKPAATGEKEADTKAEPAKESKAEAAAPAAEEKKGQ